MKSIEQGGARALQDLEGVQESRESRLDQVSQKLHDFCSPLYDMLSKQEAILAARDEKPEHTSEEFEQLRVELEEALQRESEDKEAIIRDLMAEQAERFRSQLMSAIVRMQSQFIHRENAYKDRYRVEEHRLRQQVEEEIASRMEGARKVIKESKRAAFVGNVFKHVPTSKLALLSTEQGPYAIS